jgi:hypothetical protein
VNEAFLIVDCNGLRTRNSRQRKTTAHHDDRA